MYETIILCCLELELGGSNYNDVPTKIYMYM